jgi:uncharacterized membrane protein
MMRFKKVTQGLALAVFYIFLIWLAYQIILKIAGHSPSLETILSTAIAMIISFLLVATLKVGEFMGETRSFMNHTTESFRLITIDINRIRDDLGKRR